MTASCDHSSRLISNSRNGNVKFCIQKHEHECVRLCVWMFENSIYVNAKHVCRGLKEISWWKVKKWELFTIDNQWLFLSLSYLDCCLFFDFNPIFFHSRWTTSSSLVSHRFYCNTQPQNVLLTRKFIGWYRRGRWKNEKSNRYHSEKLDCAIRHSAQSLSSLP